MKDITFGQYYPTDSFVHKMDPRSKIVLTILMIVSVFFIKDYFGYAILAVFLAVVLISARIKLRMVLKSIRPVLFLVLFMAILNIFLYQKGEPLLEYGFIYVTDEALIFASLLALRLIFLVIISSVLTFTTTPVAITDGIESLLKPLTWIKIPVHVFALTMSITLRFIPILSEETSKIINAQKARGGDFESGNIFKRVKSLIPILIPLLVGSFRHAQELSQAMDARCYNGSKGRTKFKKLHFSFYDLLGVLFSVAIFLAILMNRYVFLMALI